MIDNQFENENGTDNDINEITFSQNSFYRNIPYGLNEKSYGEKRDIRKISAAVGISMIAVFLIMLFWARIALPVFSFFGVSNLEAVKILTDPYSMQAVQIVLSTLTFTLPFIITTLCIRGRVIKTVCIKKVKKGSFVPYYFIGIGFCAFVNIAVEYAGRVFESFGVNYPDLSETEPRGLAGFILFTVSSAVVPALCEEFAVRGVIFGLLKKYGDTFALVTSSVLFGLMHGNFNQIPFALLVGLILGFVRIKTESLWVCIAIHFTNNFISVLMDYGKLYFSANILGIVYTLFCLVTMLAGIGFLLLRQKKDINALNLENVKTECTEKQKYTWYFTAPLTIISVLLFLGEAVYYFF